MLVSDNAGIVVGTGDFCYSFWVKMASVSTEQVLLSTLTTDHGTDGFYIDYHPATYKLLHYSPLGGGLHYNAATGAMTAGAYQYVEYSRTAGVGYLSIDGHMVTSFADTNNYSSRVLFMGGITYTPVGAVPTAGDWDEFRLLVGKGGHTSDFTPPTSAFLDGP